MRNITVDVAVLGWGNDSYSSWTQYPSYPRRKLLFATKRRLALLCGDLLRQHTSYNKARTKVKDHWPTQWLFAHPRNQSRSFSATAALGASKRTRRYYARKAGQSLSTLLQDIAPSDSGYLFKAVYSSGVIQRTLQCNGEEATSSSVDETMMSALAECYRAAGKSCPLWLISWHWISSDTGYPIYLSIVSLRPDATA